MRNKIYSIEMDNSEFCIIYTELYLVQLNRYCKT